MLAHDEVYYACWGKPPPPSYHPPKTKGGGNSTFEKLREKTPRREYIRPSRYTSDFRHDVSDIPSGDRGSKRMSSTSIQGVTFGESQREKTEGRRRERCRRNTPRHQCIRLVLPSTPAVNASQRRRSRPRNVSVAKLLASQ